MLPSQHTSMPANLCTLIHTCPLTQGSFVHQCLGMLVKHAHQHAQSFSCISFMNTQLHLSPDRAPLCTSAWASWGHHHACKSNTLAHPQTLASEQGSFVHQCLGVLAKHATVDTVMSWAQQPGNDVAQLGPAEAFLHALARWVGQANGSGKE